MSGCRLQAYYTHQRLNARNGVLDQEISLGQTSLSELSVLFGDWVIGLILERVQCSNREDRVQQGQLLDMTALSRWGIRHPEDVIDFRPWDGIMTASGQRQKSRAVLKYSLPREEAKVGVDQGRPLCLAW